MSAVFICTGGTAEWVTQQADCRRCFGRWTFFGRSQAWYGTDWICGHCGAELNEDGWRWGSARKDRDRALRARRSFAAWLIAGSPTWRNEAYV